jgi:2-haloacid dehalogenase
MTDVISNSANSLRTESPIRAAVFDLGGVLLDWDPRHLYRTLFADEAEMERFLGEVCTPQWHEPHDRGVPAATSCADLAARFPDQAELIWAWAERSEEMVAGEIAASIDVLRDVLATGLPCFALTNMEAETYPRRLARFPFLSWFEGTVVSGFEGVAKPDRQIFDLILTRFALAAPTTLMIDNTEENIEAARQVGMPTILFRSPEQLRRELQKAGVLP